MQRDELLAGGRHPLTYCTNVHPADDLDAAERVDRDQAAPILRNALGDGTLYLGAWWPADVAHALASDADRLARHAEPMAQAASVGNVWWREAWTQNHHSINAAGLAAAGYVLRGEVAEAE